jgi:hypothetical protein
VAPWLVLTLATALGLGLVAMLVRRLRRRAAAPAFPALPGPDADLPALAAATRSALVARLGPSWAARTTEELAAAEAELAAAFGAGPAGRLLELLRAADRARFADADEPAGPYRAFVAEFLAGARSMTTAR